MSGLFRRDDVTPGYILFPREIFRRDEEDRRRRCWWHHRGGLTKCPAEKIRGTAGVVRGLCGLRAFLAGLGLADKGSDLQLRAELDGDLSRVVGQPEHQVFPHQASRRAL